jgi:hypothetical protein
MGSTRSIRSQEYATVSIAAASFLPPLPLREDEAEGSPITKRWPTTITLLLSRREGE